MDSRASSDVTTDAENVFRDARTEVESQTWNCDTDLCDTANIPWL